MNWLPTRRKPPTPLLFVTNYATPYQLSAFSRENVSVLTCNPTDSRRHWGVLSAHNFTDLSPLGLPSRIVALARAVLLARRVLVGGLGLHSLVAIFFARLTRCQYAIWLERPRRRLPTLKRVLLRLTLGKRGSLAAVGTLAQEAYRLAGIPRDRVWALPYSYGPQAPDSSPTAPHTRPGDRLRIIFVGGEPYRKGLDLLFNAIDAGCLQRRVRVDVAGAPDIPLAALPDYAQNLGVLQPDEISTALGASDLLVLPARFEGWGVVVEEAFSCSLPVIVSDEVGATGGLVTDGINGIVTRAGCISALAHSLSYLDESRDTLRLLSLNAQASVQRFRSRYDIHYIMTNIDRPSSRELE